MSALLLGKVLATNIPTGPKFVLTVLADHANDFGGSCFPSVPLIADKCSQTEVSVRKHIQWLEAHGLILRNHGRGEATFYQLVVSKIDDLWVDLRAKHLQAYVKAERARGRISAPPLEKLSTGTTQNEEKPRVFTEKESYGVNFLPRKNLTGLNSCGVTANPDETKKAAPKSPPKNLTGLNSYPVNNLGYNRLICLKTSSNENTKLSTGLELGAQTAVEEFCAHLIELENERGKRITIKEWELAKVASWVRSGFTLQDLTTAHQKAVTQRTKKSDPAPIGVGYLDPILRAHFGALPNRFANHAARNPNAKPAAFDSKEPWYLTDKGIEEEALRLGLSAHPGETFPQFKDRILAYKRVSREQYAQDLQRFSSTFRPTTF